MRNRKLWAALLLLFAASGPAFAGTWNGYKVGRLLPPDIRDCVFFQLEGVSQADAVAPGSPWFAVSRNALGFKEIYALLLTAKASEIPLTVETVGQLSTSCGSTPVVALWQIYTTN